MGHPAHYHNVTVVMDQLREKGHEVLTVGREKDVLIDLMKDIPYQKIFLAGKKGNSKAELARSVLKRLFQMIRITRRFKPDLLIGTDIVITHVGSILGIPSVLLNEDDTDQIPLFTKYGCRFASAVLSPLSCPGEPYEYKTYKYPGYHELAYLHPRYFTPDRSKIEHLFKGRERFSIIRFSALQSHHDVGRSGITDELALEIIQKLEKVGAVHVSAEREKALSPLLQPYQISIEPQYMHHALAHCHIYVGDSQTMAAEAAVLGTPSVRFNDFVGKLGYLEELEHRFGLTFGIKTSQPDQLLATIEQLVNRPDLKEEWEKKSQQMLTQCIDVAAFMTWFFEKFPVDRRKIDIRKKVDLQLHSE